MDDIEYLIDPDQWVLVNSSDTVQVEFVFNDGVNTVMNIEPGDWSCIFGQQA